MNSSSNNPQIGSLKHIFETPCDYSESGKPIYQIDYLKDRALNSIWVLVATIFFDFPTRRAAFFAVLERLIREGRVQLHHNGLLIVGAADQQLATLQAAWPESAETATAISMPNSLDRITTELGMNLWFFMEACPVGIAWRQSNGTYLPAD